MTFITLMAVKNGRLYIKKSHYTSIAQDLNHEISGIKSKGKGSADLSEGYILIDTKSKIIVNQQDCIRIDGRKGYSIII